MIIFIFLPMIIFGGLTHSKFMRRRQVMSLADLKGIPCYTPWVVRHQVEISEAWFLEWINLQKHSSICLLDEMEKELLGYVFWDRADRGTLAAANKLGITKEVWSIIEIAKSHKLNRRGVGGELMDRAHAAIGLEKCFSLHVAMTNDVAIRLYKRKGYLLTLVKHNYYQLPYKLKVGEDAYLMFHKNCFQEKKGKSEVHKLCGDVKSLKI